MHGAEMRTRCGRGRATVARLGGQGGPWGVDGANSGSAQARRVFAPCGAPLASVDRRTPAWYNNDYSNSTSCNTRALHDKHAPTLGLAIRGMCAWIVDAAPTLAAPTPRPRATAVRALAGDPVAGLRKTAQRPGEPVDVEGKFYVSKSPHARAPERVRSSSRASRECVLMDREGPMMRWADEWLTLGSVTPWIRIKGSRGPF